MFKKAFTLVEVIISLLILGITMVGVTNLVIYSKRQTGQAHSRMVQGELEKYFFDRLQMHVREDTWDTTPGNYLTSGDYRSPNNPYFTYTTVGWLEEFDRRLNPNPPPAEIMYYSAQRVRGVTGTSLRKVKLTISYPSGAYE